MDPSSNDPVSEDKAYWFRAKRYGWGWGPPVTWQGWMVLVTWFLILALGLFVIESRRGSLGRMLLYISLMSSVLVLVCYWKGEPPKWRWGGPPT